MADCRTLCDRPSPSITAKQSKHSNKYETVCPLIPVSPAALSITKIKIYFLLKKLTGNPAKPVINGALSGSRSRPFCRKEQQTTRAYCKIDHFATRPRKRQIEIGKTTWPNWWSPSMDSESVCGIPGRPPPAGKVPAPLFPWGRDRYCHGCECRPPSFPP